MSYELKNMQTQIEDLPHCHQLGILKILVENQTQDYEIQEKEKKGCFVQLNKVPTPVLKKMKAYMDYVQNQETELSKNEMEKEKMREFFTHPTPTPTPP